MNYLVILTIALAPGIFWLWIITRWDRYHPEPRSLIIRTFLLGMAIAVPLAIIEALLYPGSVNSSSGQLPLLLSFYLSFIVAGLPEELANRNDTYTGLFLKAELQA